ncbi:magnesium transporter [Serratia marcescens]|uniref:Magnesium transporter n=1 Tax=Serratia sarumanii TaxID=3020826 RepID=A0ABW8QJA3_9GAMM|nr:MULTISPECIES: magnesium transporter [Serratia]ASL97757.1 magnesium transporter [Serratia marcescens]EGS9993679.1 magnesium transporter [Serratia marcescens]ELJ5769737.1 magnesium transporter [Serratia marcescens]ELJ5814668.1 magnesium transporter [Serratia marcescens]ELN8906632.1 magnesium transporter [Serratia marcescens]
MIKSHQHYSSPALSATETLDETSVAGYMNADFITVPATMTVNHARKYLLSQLKTDEIPTRVFITADDYHLRGTLSVKKLLQCDEQDKAVGVMMDHSYFQVSPDGDRNDVAHLLGKGGLDVVPVVANNTLVGVLGEREIARLVEAENTEDAQRQGASLPLDKPYLETSPWALWRKRSVWLLMLFVAEAYTGNVLKAFEEQLEAAIALAFFIPLLIGTGGNSGTQITSTLVRAMALGEVSLRNLGAVIRKEVTTSLLIAVTIGLAAWVRAWIMGVGMEVTLVVSLSLVAITVWSAIVSSIIPMLLKRLGIDPAVVSAPFIATFIDGTGLIIYFKIAQYVLGI